MGEPSLVHEIMCTALARVKVMNVDRIKNGVPQSSAISSNSQYCYLWYQRRIPEKIADCSRDSNDAFRKIYSEHSLCDYPCRERVFLLDRVDSNDSLSKGFRGRSYHRSLFTFQKFSRHESYKLVSLWRRITKEWRWLFPRPLTMTDGYTGTWPSPIKPQRYIRWSPLHQHHP